MKRMLFIIFILMTFMFVFACNDADDDDDDNNDNVDDDEADDNDDESSGTNNPPIVSESYFSPDPAAEGSVDGEGTVWHTQLFFTVCDEDNDLLPDGSLVYDPGQPWELEYLPLTLYQDPPAVDLTVAGDCQSPVTVPAMILILDAALEPGQYCADFYVEDSAKNTSDVFSPCFTMP